MIVIMAKIQDYSDFLIDFYVLFYYIIAGIDDRNCKEKYDF